MPKYETECWVVSTQELAECHRKIKLALKYTLRSWPGTEASKQVHELPGKTVRLSTFSREFSKTKQYSKCTGNNTKLWHIKDQKKINS